jgi:3-dehydroquinate dehydratase
LIVTCRDNAQGGVNDYPDNLRISILAEAVRMGADYVDCEYSNYTKPEFRESLTAVLTAHRKTRLILSAHDFKGPFSDIRFFMTRCLLPVLIVFPSWFLRRHI